jgi:hypothetical protein
MRILESSVGASVEGNVAEWKAVGVGGSETEAKVDARFAGSVVSKVQAMPKLAMDLYMYLAGLVKDNVGVTWSQIYVGTAGDT